MRKKFALLFLALMLLFAAGCAAKPAADLKDMMGNPVALQKYPERIVSLTPSNTEIVCALGLEKKLVGVDAYSDYPESVKSIGKVGDFNGPNIETVVALKPDIVLSGNALQQDAIDKLKSLGVTVVVTEATTYDDIFKSIELVGELTGTQKKAKEVTTDMKAKEKAVLDTVLKAPSGKLVYYAMSYGDAGNWTAGPGAFPYTLIGMCGGKNLTEGKPVAWVNLNQEELVSQDPDVVLISSDMGSDASAFSAAEAYKGLKAVKNNQVFIINANLCNRPGPRIVEGLREYAQYITGQTIKFPGE